ncbi:MAG TPA: hypothetical protein VND54_02130 [Candidatus Saccharimonadales bacterium]|nr:hypothetical protein [Candidatus Saccharimonadales bacterium]
MAIPSVSKRFDFIVDQRAKGWLEEHPEASRLFIMFTAFRACCSGVRVCDVRIRVGVAPTRRGSGESWIGVGQVEGRAVFVDARLVERMPTRLPLTGRGIGRFRRLDLDLSSEQWAELLYPACN